MNQVLKELATDEEVENAFRDRHSSITDSNQTIDTRGDGSVFGAPLPADENRISVVICSVNFLRDCALTHCGLFRVPELVRVNKIKAAFEAGEKVDLDNFVGNMGDSNSTLSRRCSSYIFENFPIRCFRSRAIADSSQVSKRDSKMMSV